MVWFFQTVWVNVDQVWHFWPIPGKLSFARLGYFGFLGWSSSWTTAYRRPWVLGGFEGFWVVLGFWGGGADNVLGCPPYKIFSWTCCYAIHSSLAPYPGTRYQLLLVTCKTLLIFALLFLGGVLGGFWGGADNVLGCPPYKIFSWTCCYAIHSSLAPYPGTRYQLLLVTCAWVLHCCFLGGVLGGLITFLAARLTRYSLGLAATLSTLLLHRTLAHAINFFLSLARHSWFLHCCFLGGGVLWGADNVLGCPPYKIFSWTCCYT